MTDWAIRSNRVSRRESAESRTEMVLLASRYPSELDAQRALSGFRKANPRLKAWLVRSPSGEGVSDGEARRKDLVAETA